MINNVLCTHKYINTSNIYTHYDAFNQCTLQPSQYINASYASERSSSSYDKQVKSIHKKNNGRRQKAKQQQHGKHNSAVETGTTSQAS